MLLDAQLVMKKWLKAIGLEITKDVFANQVLPFPPPNVELVDLIKNNGAKTSGSLDLPNCRLSMVINIVLRGTLLGAIIQLISLSQ